MTEPRPKTLTQEMLSRVGEKLATSLAESGRIEQGEIAGCAADIAKVGRLHMDGYELAKTLDARCYWDCDLMMAEDLDGFSSMADAEIKAAQKAWAKRNNIEPPYPIGTRVKTRHGEIGLLDEVYPHDVAKYCVKVDGDKNKTRRSIVAFEDVIPVEVVAITQNDRTGEASAPPPER
jgi:hypothetical protein